MNTEQLITDFNSTFTKIKKQYNFLELDDNIWNNLIVDHIISIAANVNFKEKKDIIDYVKHTFLIKLTSYIKEEMDINDVFNKFINYKLATQEDKKTNILEIDKLSNFLSSLELEVEIKLLEKLFEQNKEIVRICNSIVGNNYEIKKSQLELFSNNVLTVEILELFCTYKKIKIIDDTLDIIDNNHIDDTSDCVFEEDANNFLINSIRNKNLPVLTREEELDYFNQYKSGNAEALNILVERNQRLVVSIAKKFVGKGVEISDLIQEGNIGLMTAIDKYDPTKGFKFSTYATYWIKRAAFFAIGNQAKTIRIPLTQREKIRKFNIIKNEMAQSLDREPTIEELAKELKVSIEEINSLNDPNMELMSLNMNIGDEHDVLLVDVIPDKRNKIEEEILKIDVHKMLEVCDLKEIEKNILCLRHGLYDGNCRTLEEIAKILGKTRQGIRNIEKRTYEKIKSPKYIGLISDYMDIPDNQLQKIKK